MAKKYVVAVLFIVVVLSIAVCISFAQQTVEEAKAELSNVRLEKGKIKYDYQQEVQKVTKAADAKLVALKADFHKVRNECLEDKKNKLNKLQADYEAKIGPVEQEEKRLLEILAPTGGMNFVKSKKK